jgi:hypothetical protein
MAFLSYVSLLARKTGILAGEIRVIEWGEDWVETEKAGSTDAEPAFPGERREEITLFTATPMPDSIYVDHYRYCHEITYNVSLTTVTRDHEAFKNLYSPPGRPEKKLCPSEIFPKLRKDRRLIFLTE